MPLRNFFFLSFLEETLKRMIYYHCYGKTIQEEEVALKIRTQFWHRKEILLISNSWFWSILLAMFNPDTSLFKLITGTYIPLNAMGFVFTDCV